MKVKIFWANRFQFSSVCSYHCFPWPCHHYGKTRKNSSAALFANGFFLLRTDKRSMSYWWVGRRSTRCKLIDERAVIGSRMGLMPGDHSTPRAEWCHSELLCWWIAHTYFSTGLPSFTSTPIYYLVDTPLLLVRIQSAPIVRPEKGLSFLVKSWRGEE